MSHERDITPGVARRVGDRVGRQRQSVCESQSVALPRSFFFYHHGAPAGRPETGTINITDCS